MKEFYIDCTGLGKEDLHRALAECLDFPEWYGNNLDALYDELTEISQETLVILCNFNAAEPSCKGFKRVMKDAESENAAFHVVFDTPPAFQVPCGMTGIRRQYKADPSPERLDAMLARFVNAYRNDYLIGNLLVEAGDDAMEKGDTEAALVFLKAAEKCPNVGDETTLYLRLAQIHLEKGQQEEGVAYLIKLCTEGPSNYEESIGFRELTEVWNRYRHLVDGLVPPSVSIYSGPRPLSPDECSRSIAEIWALPEDEILSALSDHVGEMSGSGEELNYLNKWERSFFYLDEISMEVNSGGFDSYLFHCGEHFHKARKALEAIDSPAMTALLDAVTAKFPRGKVPKSMDAIQNALEKLEEKGVDFEEQDDAYYNGVESEFLPKLLTYVLENKKHFR